MSDDLFDVNNGKWFRVAASLASGAAGSTGVQIWTTQPLVKRPAPDDDLHVVTDPLYVAVSGAERAIEDALTDKLYGAGRPERCARQRALVEETFKCADLFLLELCVGNFLDKTGQMKPLLEAAKQKGKPSDWYPTWKQMLQQILKEKTIEVNPMARKRLTKLVNDPDYTALDGYVHNRFVTAHARDLRDLGGALEDIFVVVLSDAPPPTAT